MNLAKETDKWVPGTKSIIRKWAHMNLAKETRFFIMLTLLMSIAIYTIESYGPSLPAITYALKTNSGLVTATVTCYLIAFGAATLIYAPYSDRYGRKPIVIAGMIVFLISSIFATFVNSITTLLIARFFQGVGMSVVPGLIRCMTADIANNQGNHLSRLIHKSGMLFRTMPAVAPIIGGFLQYHFGWRYNLASLILLGIISLATSIWILPETIITKNKNASLSAASKEYWILLRMPRFLVYPLMSGATFGGIIIYLSYSPYFYQNILHLNAFQNGLIGFIAMIAIITSHYINAQQLKKRSLTTMMIFSGSLQALAGVISVVWAICFKPSIMTLAIPFFIYMMGDAGIRASAYARAIETVNLTKSSISAVYTLVQFWLSGLSIILFMNIKLHSPLLLGVVFCAAGIFIVFGSTTSKTAQ